MLESARDGLKIAGTSVEQGRGIVESATRSSWVDHAWRLYEYAPPMLDKAAKGCLSLALPWSALRIPVAILRGLTHTGRSGTIVVAGIQPWIDYLPSRFFASMTSREAVRTVPVWALPSVLRRLG